VIHALDGQVMPYAWGSRSALADLLGRVPSGRPEAELWIGAHRAGPAQVLSPSGVVQTLPRLLLEDLPARLGPDIAARYGRLPFLLKILAIAEPLSLQAHPDAVQARLGFEREQSLGLPLGDPKRSYKDDSHKPELLLALSPVEALCGFRPPGEVLSLLSTFGLADSTSPLSAACAAFAQVGDEQGYEALFRSFFALPVEALRQTLSMLLLRARSASAAGGEATQWVANWLLRMDSTYGVDPGLLGMLLLRPLRLEPGQAVFLPARRLHAYLSGVGVEVMAESDNVLRGGLTSKHVDVDELCRILDFRPSEPDLIEPATVDEGGGRVYRTPVDEFELWSVEPAQGQGSVSVPSPCLFVVLEGEIELTQGAEQRTFTRGGQGFVSWASDPLRLTGRGRVALATARSVP